MNRFAIILVLLTVTPLGSADGSNYDDLITKMCSQGVPWTLPKVQGTFSFSEVYISLNGDGETTMRVCHCTEDIDENVMYIWIRSQDNPAVAPSKNELQSETDSYKLASGYPVVLRGRGCMDVRGSHIAIHHEDKNNGRWGTYQSPIESSAPDEDSK